MQSLRTCHHKARFMRIVHNERRTMRMRSCRIVYGCAMHPRRAQLADRAHRAAADARRESSGHVAAPDGVASGSARMRR